MVPASTHDDVWLVLLEFERKHSVVVSWFVPFYGVELVFKLLGLLVVYADYVIFACTCERGAIGSVIKSHDVIAFLEGMPNFFACLGCELVEMAAGIGN